MSTFLMSWLRPVLTLLAVVGAIVINGLSNRYPLLGETVADLSNTVFEPVRVIPASYAFIVWALIYIGLLALGVYQLQARHHRDPKLAPNTYFLVLASIAQCLWIYLFLTRQFGLSVLAMVEILVFLIAFYLRIRTPANLQRVTRSDRWYLYRPLSLYMGWISVATIVNVASTLYLWGWGREETSAIAWTISVMARASFLALRLLVRYGDVTYVGVVIWALVAIAVANRVTLLIVGPAIALATILGLLVLLQTRQGSLHS